MSVKELKKIYSLAEFPRARTILVIGCGGTGGHLIPHLTRYIKVKRDSLQINLILADGDVVEEKNLTRQHFIDSDIAKNKAMVLAERYSSAFGIEIKVIPNDLESAQEIQSALELYRIGYNASYMVIGCVDNNASRKAISEWFNNYKYLSKFWIDAGNEERAGQVICGFAPSNYHSSLKAGPKQGTSVGIFSMPSAVDYYPELLDDSSGFNSELSCADRAISAPQNMQTNVSAATIIMNYARKAIDGEPFRSHGVEFTIDNVYNTKLNTAENLEKVHTQRRLNWEL